MKISLSEVLFKVSKFCPCDGKITPPLETILAIVKTLLQDTDTQVRLKLIQHIHEFNR